MMTSQLYMILSTTILLFGHVHCNTYTTPQCNSCAFAKEARHFFEDENELLRKRQHQLSLAEFRFATNLTEFNQEFLKNISFSKTIADKDLAERILRAGYVKINDTFIKRQAEILMHIGFSKQADHNLIKFKKISNHSNLTFCDYKNATICNLTLADVTKRKALSRDAAVLAYYWNLTQDATSSKSVRRSFKNYLHAINSSIRLNNHKPHVDYWLQFYDDFDMLYEAILPLYKELHTFLRHHLKAKYGSDIVSITGNIPIHLRDSIMSDINAYLPFPKKPLLNITTELLRHKFNVKRIIESGDEFFKSLYMHPLPESFWQLSVFERPLNITMICHPMAWDMFKSNDMRITMCAKVNAYYWYAIHHELGHIQYQLQYEQQPTAFHSAPHPGIHEAIAELITMFVGTQQHLKRIGFVENKELDEESRINKLFEVALKKVLYLPFLYSMAKWRLKVIRNEINESAWNCAYWKIVSKYAGIEPPMRRSENVFDPPEKFFDEAAIMRYATSGFFQFQFYKALCLKAGQYKLNSTALILDNCDIYNNKEAGEALAKFLSRGSSRHWKEALEELTGETTLNPNAMLDYFEPLYKWLQHENKRLNSTLGWRITDKVKYGPNAF